jgi:hypothetical protein
MIRDDLIGFKIGMPRGFGFFNPPHCELTRIRHWSNPERYLSLRVNQSNGNLAVVQYSERTLANSTVGGNGNTIGSAAIRLSDG